MTKWKVEWCIQCLTIEDFRYMDWCHIQIITGKAKQSKTNEREQQKKKLICTFLMSENVIWFRVTNQISVLIKLFSMMHSFAWVFEAERSNSRSDTNGIFALQAHICAGKLWEMLTHIQCVRFAVRIIIYEEILCMPYLIRYLFTLHSLQFYYGIDIDGWMNAHDVSFIIWTRSNWLEAVQHNGPQW